MPLPRHPGGGHARRGTSRQRAHKPRLRAPHRRIPLLLPLPQHIYYSTFRPKRKGFSFIIIVFCFGRGGNVVFGQSGCVRFCRETVQAVWGQLSCNDKNQAAWVCNAKGSRGRPQSPLVAPAGAKPLRNKKDQETWVCTAQKSSFPPPKSKKSQKMTIRCNEIAFSFVLYHEGGYVINAADSTQ